MRHHTNYCKWIHGGFVLFDHALKTNLKAVCISKYDLAVKMLEWAINNRFPNCTVLADSWFGIGPFIKELKRLKLGYVVEIKDIYTVRTPCKKPKLTPKGRSAKNQYDLITLPKVFKNILTFTKCGFAADKEKGKEEKTIYHTKIITGRLNSIAGKHRIIQSIDPTKQTTKYLLTDQLTWEATKIISVYSHRWVIEEFFNDSFNSPSGTIREHGSFCWYSSKRWGFS